MAKHKYFPKLLIGLFLISLAAFISACSESAIPTTNPNPNPSANNTVANSTNSLPTLAPATITNPKIGYATSPVAIVNNHNIEASEFNHALDQSRISFEEGNKVQGKFDWTTEANQQQLHDLRGQTLEGLINFAVVSQQAVKENVKVTDAEVEARLTEFKKQLGDQPSAYTNWLTQHYLTDEDERAELKQTILFEKMEDMHSGNVQTTAEQVHVRFILVGTQAEATDIYNKLKGGADFAAIARQFSLDPGTATKGGDLGFIFPGGTEPEFEKTAFSLQNNQIGSPVKTSLGWNIIQSLGKETRPLPIDLVQQRKSEAFGAYIKTLRDQAKIEELLKP